MLERVKSDRMIASGSIDEDRRRRTIIVEKKGSGYGFTLQSYGIHYKKDNDVEMITYVDHVEYDGPAYKAGMREGDVILSINGTDMENADHKTLVNFIKNCDNRMRMVVLFENCVRKVELHIRYIQLQEILQNKMAELERVCLKEKELLEGKWKTHSLPARKKAVVATENGINDSQVSPSDPEIATMPYTRPLSTEDVAKLSKQTNTIIPPPAQFILAYQYLDPQHRYIMKSSTTPNSSGEYLVSTNALSSSSLPRSGHQNFIIANEGNNSYTNVSNRSPSTQNRQPHHHHHHTTEQPNSVDAQKAAKPRRHHHGNGNSCHPCMGHFISKRDKSNEKDNTSLDAYDLASPCCDPNCVPVKRRSRHHKEHHHKHKHNKDKERPPRPRSQTHASPQLQTAHTHYHDMSTQMTSHCSLYSCDSNTVVDGSATSVNTENLWESKGEPSPHNHYNYKQRPNSMHHQPTAYIQRYVHPSQVQPIQNSITNAHAYVQPQYNSKPKSWDNLAAAKGCSYGYVVNSSGTHVNSQRKLNSSPCGRYSTFSNVENYVPAPTQFLQEATITKMTIITTKSTENLIQNADDSCECLVQPPNCSACITSTPYQGYYSNLSRNNANNRCIVPTKTEITRL